MSVSIELFSLLTASLEKHLELGDARLDERTLTMAAASFGGDGISLSRLFGSAPKELKAAQRHLSNERVGVDELRRALYGVTADEIQRQLKGRRCVVAFDPSELDYTWHASKPGRRAIGDGRGRGYEWDNLAAMDPSSGRFLGVLSQSLITETGPDDAHLYDYVEGMKELSRAEFRELSSNPKQRFLTQMRAVDRRLPPEQEVVFVADREFDDGLLLRSKQSLRENSHFVIRATGWRAVQMRAEPWVPSADARRKPSMPYRLKDGRPTEGLVDVHLKDVLPFLPQVPLRELSLDKRGRVCASDGAHRTAKLSAGAVPIRLVSASKRARRGGIAEESVWLNLVVVREQNPPDGVSPVFWMLITDLPVNTLEQIAEAVDLYVCRWRIEEFFRTAKDALQLERSKLEDPAALARLLFFITLKAIALDVLRADAQLKAGRIPTDEERRALVAGAARAEEIQRRRGPADVGADTRLTRRERAVMLLGLLATKGGWTGKRNSHLGNYILLRGLRWLLDAVHYGLFAWLVRPPRDVG